MCFRKIAILSLLSAGLLAGSEAFSQEQFAFRVHFRDKKGAPSLDDAAAYLSPRALQRRAAFGILPDESDRPVSPHYIESVRQLTGGRIRTVSRWLNHCTVLVDDSADIMQLRELDFITETEFIASFPGELQRDKTAASSSPAGILGLPFKTTADPAYYGATWTQTSLVNGGCLHDMGYRGQGKLIAVLDDGFMYVNTAPGFDSLRQQGRIADRYNFVLSDTGVYSYGGHGTTVLSTMAGLIPNTYVGAAPSAQYALYITEDVTSEQSIEMDYFLAATERADSIGADIISSSLGYNTFNPPSVSLVYADLDGKTTVAAKAVNAATRKGILCVISAGNEGGNSWNYILTPGDADSALTVGNVDANKNVAGNSGWGPNAAGIIKPNVCAMGSPAQVLSSGSNPYSINGTSMSTPQIAGFAACLMQAVPGRPPLKVRESIEMSSHLYSNPNFHAGYGVPDFCAAFQILDVPEPDARATVSILPNPFNTQFTLVLNAPHPAEGQLDIFDLTGKIIRSTRVILQRGNNRITLSLDEAQASGMYIGRLSTGNNVEVFRLLKH